VQSRTKTASNEKNANFAETDQFLHPGRAEGCSAIRLPAATYYSRPARRVFPVPRNLSIKYSISCQPPGKNVFRRAESAGRECPKMVASRVSGGSDNNERSRSRPFKDPGRVVRSRPPAPNRKTGRSLRAGKALCIAARLLPDRASIVPRTLAISLEFTRRDFSRTMSGSGFYFAGGLPYFLSHMLFNSIRCRLRDPKVHKYQTVEGLPHRWTRASAATSADGRVGLGFLAHDGIA